MDKGKDSVAVFEPGSVPRSRKTTKQRRRGATCCFIVVGGLSTLVCLFIGALIAKTLIYNLDVIVSPHTSTVQESGQTELEEVSIKPLISSTTPFDIRVTVWLDVTSHLDQGKTLPTDLRVLHYRQHGKKRSEAVIFSRLLFQNATMDSHLHTSARIRFPVEPLYTQSLGPATLRGTFQVVPHFDAPEGLTFNTSIPIYPPQLPIGPRTPNPSGIDVISNRNENDRETWLNHPSTLEECMEYSAINVNLLTLLQTQWRLNDTKANLRSDYGVDSPMYDGAPSNRAFHKVNNSSNSTDQFYISTNTHNIMLPHVRTRSRIIMIREDRNFSMALYTTKFKKAHEDMRTKCAGLMKRQRGSEEHVSDGSCPRPIDWSIYENFIHFFRNTSTLSEEAVRNATTHQFRYAPFLTQRTSSSAYRHHRTIPRHIPGSEEKGTLLSSEGKEDVCRVPMLETDESQRFFEFDWDVAFSSHKHMRASLAETMDGKIGVSSQLEDFKDDGTELRVKSRFVDEAHWEVYGK
jgi:hypothetical protein